jgi:hypothetical protein
MGRFDQQIADETRPFPRAGAAPRVVPAQSRVIREHVRRAVFRLADIPS